MGPLRTAARLWRERTGVEVEWSARPLASFNDQPVEELALEFRSPRRRPPVLRHSGSSGASLRSICSDDLLAALGARAPATWDEVTALARRDADGTRPRDTSETARRASSRPCGRERLTVRNACSARV